MTIQISITIWTILCFLALMLILHHLLFKPVLSVIDRRKARIEAAAAKKEEYERIVLEHEAKLIEQKEAAHEAARKSAKDEIERIRLQSKKALEDAKNERIRELDFSHSKAEIERAEILRILSSHAKDLAETFAKSVVKE